MTKFGTITHVGKKRISRGSATPPIKGVGPQRPKNFGAPTYAHTV